MKLRKLFVAAGATLALTLSMAFSANAELITQSFKVDVDGTTATIEVGANTEKSYNTFDGFYDWDFDNFEFFNVLGLALPGETEASDYSLMGMDFDFLTLEAFVGSISGPGFVGNGFSLIEFGLDLGVFSDTLSGFIAEVVIFNDDFGTDGFFEVFTGQDFIDGTLAVMPGSVKVNAPATALFMMLSVGGLLLARRK